MLKVNKITDIFDTEYNNVKYPIIEAEVLIDDDDVPITENFGPESLGNALIDSDGIPYNREAYNIDGEMYAYVPDDLHKKSHEEIIAYIEKEID